MKGVYVKFCNTPQNLTDYHGNVFELLQNKCHIDYWQRTHPTYLPILKIDEDG